MPKCYSNIEIVCYMCPVVKSLQAALHDWHIVLESDIRGKRRHAPMRTGGCDVDASHEGFLVPRDTSWASNVIHHVGCRCRRRERCAKKSVPNRNREDSLK